MTVVFRTDGSVTRTGFMAIWEAVDNDGGEQGEIESPNYPNLYDDNMYEVISALQSAQCSALIPYIYLDMEH